MIPNLWQLLGLRPSLRRFAFLAGALLLAACAETVSEPVATSQPAVEAPAAGSTQPADTPLTQNPLVPAEPARSKVALLLPLSGDNGNLGKEMLDSAQLALFDLGSDKVELLPHDTQGTVAGAREAARAAQRDQVSLVIGPLFGRDAQAIRADGSIAGIPMLTFSTDWTLAGGGTYVLGFLPFEQVQRIADFAAARGAHRFAVLASQDAYGDAAVESLKQELGPLSSELVRETRFQADGRDMEIAIRSLTNADAYQQDIQAQMQALDGRTDDIAAAARQRLQSAPPTGEPDFDALLLPLSPAQLQIAAPLLAKYGIDSQRVMLLGTGLWDGEGLGTNQPGLVGAFFAAAPRDARNAFEARFQSVYGHKPPRLATLSYDATALAVVLAHDGNADPFGPAAFANAVGFAGVDGIFRFDSTGLIKRGLAVYEVTDSGVTVADPAPASFQALTN